LTWSTFGAKIDPIGNSLLGYVVVAIGLVVGVGCSQEKQMEKEPASPPNATVEFNGPGNRVDANFQGTSPE